MPVLLTRFTHQQHRGLFGIVVSGKFENLLHFSAIFRSAFQIGVESPFCVRVADQFCRPLRAITDRFYPLVHALFILSFVSGGSGVNMQDFGQTEFR